MGSLLQLTRTVPIVFPAASDPVAAGLVERLARPGGNATGFLSFEYSLSGKWPELLRQVAPSVTRAAVLRDETNPSAIAQFGVIQAVASSVGLEVFPVSLRDAAGIGRALATLAGSGDGGLILTSPGRANVLRTHIIKLAAQHKLPVVCPYRYMITDGGLISYGPDLSTSTGARQDTSIASSEARNPPTCRFRRRPSTNWWSTSRPLGRSASRCRRHCSPAPMRRSNSGSGFDRRGAGPV